MISKYFELFESNKKTYLSAAIDVLSNSENPLTVEEICFEINKQRDIFIPKSSFRSLLSTLISYSKGKEELSTTKQRNKRGTILFEITEDNPQKFKLISNVKFEEKMTFIDASQLILKQNDNRPMSAREIWDEIEEQDLVETSGATPWDTLNVEMLKYSDNSKISEKRKNSLFHVVTDNPAMFILINPKQEVQPTSEDDTEILKPKKYYLLGAYGKENPNIWRDYVSGGYWLNGFGAKTISEWQNKTGDEIFNFKDNVMNIPVGSSVAIKSTYTREKVKPAMMIKARGVVTKNYFDGIRLDVKWDSDFEPFEIMRNDVGRYQSTLHEVTSKEHIDLIWNDLALPIKQSAFSLPDDEVLPFSHFRASQAQEERNSKTYNPVSKTDKINPVYLTTQPIINEPEIKKFGYIYSTASSVVKQEVSKVSNSNRVQSPFKNAICVLGQSGMGKSTTIIKMLEENNYKYEIIIPTSSTTGLLSQFSPSAKGGKGGYIESRLGKLIIEAYNNPTENYVAVFDECHKESRIEMINDELLQAISTKRNLSRFISLDTETQDLFYLLDEDTRTKNPMIPDNFGFIFLSSKPDIILDNDDFFNRVDIYVMIKQPSETQPCKDIIQNKEFFKKFDGQRKPKIEIKQTFEVNKNDE